MNQIFLEKFKQHSPVINFFVLLAAALFTVFNWLFVMRDHVADNNMHFATAEEKVKMKIEGEKTEKILESVNTLASLFQGHLVWSEGRKASVEELKRRVDALERKIERMNWSAR